MTLVLLYHPVQFIDKNPRMKSISFQRPKPGHITGITENYFVCVAPRGFHLGNSEHPDFLLPVKYISSPVYTGTAC